MSSNIDTTTLFSGTGIDVATTVSQLVTAARAPETNWQNQQDAIQTQVTALNQLNTDLSAVWSKLNALKDQSGATGSVTTSASNPNIVTATAAAGTPPGTHVLEVSALAKTSSYYTAVPVASSSTPLTAGSFTIQVGSGTAATVTVDSTDTMATLAAKVNGLNLGVSASVVNDANGTRLALVAQSSGAASDITVTDSSALGFTKAVTGSNASLTVDGVPISSASNIVSGVVPGVTFTLTGASVGTQATVSITPNTDDSIQAVKDFVDAYNTVITELNSGFAYDQATGKGGVLSGDSSARMVQQEMLGYISQTVSGSGSISSLANLGINMNNDGTLTVDPTELNDAVTNHFTDFQTFFQSTSGFGQTVSTQLLALTSPSQGPFSVEITGLQATYKSLQSQVDDFEVYIAGQEQQWLTQYNQINVALQQLPLLQSQINAELGNSSSK
jgi:flagellar hook-associated protein 2